MRHPAHPGAAALDSARTSATDALRTHARVGLTTLSLVAGLMAVSAGPAAAECDPAFGSWKPLREVAPNAATIVVGEVVELLDLSRAATSPGASPYDWKFRLRVDRTVRGSSDPLLTFGQGIVPPGSQCIAPLQVGLGDRIALALSGPARSEGSDVLAAAYLRHEVPWWSGLPPGLEIISEADLESMAGSPPSMIPAFAVVGMLAAAVLLTLRRRSRTPASH